MKPHRPTHVFQPRVSLLAEAGSGDVRVVGPAPSPGVPVPIVGRVPSHGVPLSADAGSGDPAYRVDDLRAFGRVPPPGLSRSANVEQTRIVAEVERHLNVVEELEAAVSANLQRATCLRQSILQKAFAGEKNGDVPTGFGKQTTILK